MAKPQAKIVFSLAPLKRLGKLVACQPIPHFMPDLIIFNKILRRSA
jgi:hypothetical protein